MPSKGDRSKPSADLHHRLTFRRWRDENERLPLGAGFLIKRDEPILPRIYFTGFGQTSL